MSRRATLGPTGSPVGSGRRGVKQQVAPKASTINLDYLNGFAGDVASELRSAEDAVVAARDAEQRREGLYE